MSKSQHDIEASRRVAPELSIQEYVSLRNESLAAKQNQQSIITWTLATVGVLGAATVALAGSLHDLVGSARTLAIYTALVVCGIGVPALVLAAFGVWYGELTRMQRAGEYLRERETAVAGGKALAKSLDPAKPEQLHLIMWETMISGSRYSKNWLGSIASCALFGIVCFGSFGAALAILWNSSSLQQQLGDLRSGITIASLSVIVLGGVWIGYRGIRSALQVNRSRTPTAKEKRRK